MVNFKSSGFDKGTGGKSGKFQFDCDGCILFTRRSINITNSFSFSLYNLSLYFGGARSKGFATHRNVSKLPFLDKIGHAKSVAFRFYSTI